MSTRILPSLWRRVRFSDWAAHPPIADICLTLLFFGLAGLLLGTTIALEMPFALVSAFVSGYALLSFARSFLPEIFRRRLHLPAECYLFGYQGGTPVLRPVVFTTPGKLSNGRLMFTERLVCVYARPWQAVPINLSVSTGGVVLNVTVPVTITLPETIRAESVEYLLELSPTGLERLIGKEFEVCVMKLGGPEQASTLGLTRLRNELQSALTHAPEIVSAAVSITLGEGSSTITFPVPDQSGQATSEAPRRHHLV